MSVDLMSNMISTIKNASLVHKKFVEIPYSKECESAAKVLKDGGFLEEVKSFKVKGKAYKMLHLDLAFDENGVSLITEIKRMSKPGRRVYKKANELKRVYGGLGVLVVSTSQGTMRGTEARNKKLGGEVICKVY